MKGIQMNGLAVHFSKDKLIEKKNIFQDCVM